MTKMVGYINQISSDTNGYINQISLHTNENLTVETKLKIF